MPDNLFIQLGIFLIGAGVFMGAFLWWFEKRKERMRKERRDDKDFGRTETPD